MKKIKMNAAKLQLKKDKITSLNEQAAGQVMGGEPKVTYSFCKECHEYTYADPTGVCNPNLISAHCPTPPMG